MRSFLIIIVVLFSIYGNAQSAELANSYFRKGEYDKAILLYTPLFENNPIRQDYFKSLVTCYQQVESYEASQAIIEEQIQRFPEQIHLFIELGYNHQLQDQPEIAEKYYKQTIDYVRKNPGFVFMIGRSFRQNHLLDEALLSYQIAKELNPKLNTEISEAQIYGEKGDLEKMFSLYLDLVDKNANYFSTVQRYVGNFITEDKNDNNNLLFKKQLLKRAQSDPKDAWNILLSWQDFKTSQEAFEFMLSHSEEVLLDKESKLLAEIYLLKIENRSFSEKKDKSNIEERYQELIQIYGHGKETLELHLSFADFLTFDYDDPEKAIAHLEKIIPSAESAFEKGIIQMKIADILVFSDQFNQALILYTQIQYDLKNSQLAQEARFKVARTSYFKGDFQWAQNQLKVLKSSTSQLIANDALELSLKIGNNSNKDSLNEGLKIYAKAELLGFQKKHQQAIDTLSYVLNQYKGQQIEDEALFTQAIFYQELEAYTSAETNLLSILNFHPESLLIDDSIFALGILYRDRLNDPVKAQEMFEKIIFEFPSSIYLVDARKYYRKLRGDDI